MTLHPHEIDSLSGVSVAGKIALVTAIGRIDLLEWLKEWGLEPLAAQLDDLGIEEPSHAIDLLPEEIEGLETTPIFKLQLMKAIAHLESETTIVEDTVSRSPPGRPEQAYDELRSQLDGAAQAAQAQVLADNERMKAELEADRAANSTLRQEVARESDFLVKLSQTSEDNRRLVEMAGKVSSAHRNAFSCGRATELVVWWQLVSAESTSAASRQAELRPAPREPEPEPAPDKKKKKAKKKNKDKKK